MNDIRFAFRSLRRSPTLAIAVVLTLALCIGATTAVFSVVYTVLVVGHAAVLTGIGLLVGLAGAMLLSRLMGGLLFQVSPSDPPTLGAGVLVLSGVALVAALLPAERAARLDPSVMLRAE